MGREPKKEPGRRFAGALDSNGTFLTVLNALSDMVILNLLCLLCALPVVTAGAAIAACCRYSRKILEGSDSGVIRGFFEGFRENFRQVTPVWIGLVLVGGVLYADWHIVAMMGEGSKTVLRTGVLVAAAVVFAVALYLLPLMATFANTRRRHIVNALGMALRHLPVTVAMAAITLSPVLLALLWPGAMGWLLFAVVVVWIEAIIMVNMVLLSKVFPLYMPHSDQTEE